MAHEIVLFGGPRVYTHILQKIWKAQKYVDTSISGKNFVL